MYRWLTRCYLAGWGIQQKNHHFFGRQAGSGSLDTNDTQPFYGLVFSLLDACLRSPKCKVGLVSRKKGKKTCSLPTLMCWRASLRFSRPTVSHLLVLSKYMVAMTGRVMWIMFDSPSPEGLKIRLPIDVPLMAFSTSELTGSLPEGIQIEPLFNMIICNFWLRHLCQQL